MRTNGDVIVIGMVAGTHVLEDLGQDVPYGMSVVIPGEQALRSKDLWRAISTRCVFEVPKKLMGVPTVRADTDKEQQLELRVKELTEEVAGLRLALAAAESKLAAAEAKEDAPNEYEEKLNRILQAIEQGKTSMPAIPAAKLLEEIDGTAPTFLPSSIVPQDAQTRIDIQGEQSESGEVSKAAANLRKMRKRQ